MPKCKFPHNFEDGMLGVGVTEDIQYREAYLFVPYKLMLNINKIEGHPVLGPILLEHPEYFSEEENTLNEWEFLTLLLAMVYEVTKGKKSFWYPYLRVLPDTSFSCKWEDHILEMS